MLSTRQIDIRIDRGGRGYHFRGKHRPEFTPNVDCGEFVIIINAEKAVLTGKKLDQKFYRHHSGYIGGLKEQATES